MRSNYATIFIVIAIMTGLTLDSCNRDDPQKTREDVVFFSDEFGIPGTWEKSVWAKNRYQPDSTESIFMSGALNLAAVESDCCYREKAERSFDITADIQEVLNTNDTMLFKITCNYITKQSTGQVFGVLQFNDLNLRIDFQHNPSKSLLEILLVNWVVKDVKENGVITTDYAVTASKNSPTDSGVVFVTNACTEDSIASASIRIESFELRYPKWTID